MSRLVVYRSDRRVGVLDMTPNEEVRFSYDEVVVERADPVDAVGFRCPVRAKPWVGRDALAVFENLLPEGALRDALGQMTKHDAGDTVGLLGVVGGECAGALQLWPEDAEPAREARFEAMLTEGLDQAFGRADGLRAQVDGRASLSGTQAKLALWRVPPTGDVGVEYRLPRGGAASTVVVKRGDGRFPGLLEAELFGMRLMTAAGVPTASSAPCLLTPGCHESARFDRVVEADGSVRRLHAEDGCQLTGRTSRQKYAGQGGPTYQELVAVLERLSLDPLGDREQLFRWAVANAAMGNYDAHAKNLSVVYAQGDRVRLAPAYDVVVTALYPELDQTLALSFAGTTDPRAFTSAGLRNAAREFRLSPARAKALAVEVCERLAAATAGAADEVARLGGVVHVLDKLVATVGACRAQVEKGLLAT